MNALPTPRGGLAAAEEDRIAQPQHYPSPPVWGGLDYTHITRRRGLGNACGLGTLSPLRCAGGVFDDQGIPPDLLHRHGLGARTEPEASRPFLAPPARSACTGPLQDLVPAPD